MRDTVQQKVKRLSIGQALNELFLMLDGKEDRDLI